jgi:hypothetical protein
MGRTEVLMAYDRWTRTDSGGFVKAIKSAIGVFEEIELIENFESFFDLKYNSLIFDSDIREKCLVQLHRRLETYLAEAAKALATLHTTASFTEELTKKGMDRVAVCYIEGMVHAMEKMLVFRETVLNRIKQIKCFSKEFEEIQFLLLLLSETSEDFIPRKAADTVVQDDPLIPRTLEDVRTSLFI